MTQTFAEWRFNLLFVISYQVFPLLSYETHNIIMFFWDCFCFLLFHTRILCKSRSFWARLMNNVMVFQRFSSPACCLAWLLLDSCLTLAWVLLDSCLTLAWLLLHSCFSLVPRLKLVFRGSYFLLLIGSHRPPGKRLAQGSPASFLRFHTRILIKNDPFWQLLI